MDVYSGLGTLDADLTDTSSGHTWNNVMGAKVSPNLSANTEFRDQLPTFESGWHFSNTYTAGHYPSSKLVSECPWWR